MIYVRRFLVCMAVASLVMSFSARSIMAAETDSSTVAENSETKENSAVSEDASAVEDVENVTKNEEGSAENVENQDMVKKDTFSLHCPTECSFMLYDDVSGERRLTSEVFYIANYGNSDVLMDLSDIQIEHAERGTYKELSKPIHSDYKSETKDVFMFLKVVDVDKKKLKNDDFLHSVDIPMKDDSPKGKDYILTGTKRPSEYKVLLKAANCDKNGKFVSFDKESVFAFYIAGTVTPNKNLVWNRDDIQLKVKFDFQAVSNDSNAEEMADSTEQNVNGTKEQDNAEVSQDPQEPIDNNEVDTDEKDIEEQNIENTASSNVKDEMQKE